MAIVCRSMINGAAVVELVVSSFVASPHAAFPSASASLLSSLYNTITVRYTGIVPVRMYSTVEQIALCTQ